MGYSTGCHTTFHQIAHQVAPPNPIDALTAARKAPNKPIEKPLHD
jgi:hypothetical protein